MKLVIRQSIRRRGLRRRDRGFYLIGLLLALVIIMILAGRNYQSASGTGQGSGGGVTSLLTDPIQAQVTEVQVGNNRIDNTRDFACDTNRTQLGTELTMLSMSGGGVLPDPAFVSQKLNYIHCTGKGRLQYDDDGKTYCTEHAPAPQGLTVHDL